MKRSIDRILTTHVGSLPRPDDLRALILQRQQGQPVDEAAFAARVKTAVAETVKQQAEAGIDIVADGEMGRIGFIPYVNERLSGIEPSAAAESAQRITTKEASVTIALRSPTPIASARSMNSLMSSAMR